MRAHHQMSHTGTTTGSARRITTHRRPLICRGSTLISTRAHGKKSAVLWFKNDLRVIDHPGLQTVAHLEHLTPCYLLDPALLTGLASRPAGPEVLVSALSVLRTQLRAMGSDLVVRVGPCGDALRDLAAASSGQPSSGGEAYEGTLIVAEEEVGRVGSHNIVEALGALSGSADSVDEMDASGPQDGGRSSNTVHLWQSPMAWESSNFEMNYRLWADNGRRGPTSKLMEAPSSLPPLPPGISPGDIPTAAQLRDLLRSATLQHQTSGSGSTRELHALQARIEDQAFSSPESQHVASIASTNAEPSEILSAYLSATSAGSDDLPKLQQLVSSAAVALELPSAPGSSFKAILGPWMELGALSRRQILEGASGHQGRSPLPGRAAAAVRAVEVHEFHERLATEGVAAGRPKEVVPASSVGGDADSSTAALSPRVHQFRWRGTRNGTHG